MKKGIKKANLKRGAVIELTVMVMLLIVIMCSVLLTVIVYSNNYKNKALNNITERVALERLVNDYVIAYVKNEDLSQFDSNEKYQFISGQEGEQLTLSVLLKEQTKLVLVAKFNVSANSYTVISWDY